MTANNNTTSNEMVSFTVEERERLRIEYEHKVTLGYDGNMVFRFTHEDGKKREYVMSYAKYVLEHLDKQLPAARSYVSPAPTECDIHSEHKITDTFYDAKLETGTAWANMCPKCWEQFGTGRLGTGEGQRYQLRADGLFVKTGG